ncbi:MAG: protein-L-isoaspartate O-methyltransferase [Thiobacillaceae bacterium]|nr:protein-L-isoaspartate O-methyltransferase [Sphingomonadaceae bacterium]MCX7673620.1 protein-L-isoaspartate O-methyltransferase [Thiobacillaceae bacterium]MDW8323005.1 protein-L-isoaspartate O-methyltransferase [Burkholderiales bacterium]
MDYELARHNMIEQQIRPWEVLDQRVLDLLTRVKREDYVPPVYRSLAFVDMEIPLGHGEAMWQPKVEARVLQALAVERSERVLEVGTGSGYFTALLAALAQQVVSVEYHADLKQAAEAKLKAHGYANVTVKLGDAARDWAEDGRFDVIVLTGSTPVLPEAFFTRLNPGGRLFAVVGEPPVMQARLVTLVEGQARRTEVLFETLLKPLVNALQPERFVF